MRRRVLPLFLVFLLFSGITDDFFARFTAEPGDEVLAAANNTYLTGRPTDGRLRDPASPPPPAGARPGLELPDAAARPRRPARPTGGPLTRGDPLYLLMSLQR
jgi:hypothetical protein